jgi:hypothetical protein
MRFIGQYIQDLIARFRNDVYLEDVSSGTIASGGNLGLDSNNKIVKANEPTSHDAVTLAGTPDYITLSGQEITRNQIDLAADITGTLPVGNGGTGATTLASNSVLTGNGTSAVQAESGLTYDSEVLNVGDDDNGSASIRRKAHSDEVGGEFQVRGGDAGGTDKAGGNLKIMAGRGTGSAAGGNVQIWAGGASGGGSSSSNVSNVQCATFKTDQSTILLGNLIFEGASPDAHETTFSITDPTDDRTITVPNEDVDLAEVNHHYDYLHINCLMNAASTNQYMGYGGHYNFNIGATAYTDGGGVSNANSSKWSWYQAITQATIHTVQYNFTSTGGASKDFVFELWKITPGSGSANNTTDLIKQYSITGNASNSYLHAATDTTGYTLDAGAQLLPVIRKTGSAWSGNIFGDITIKFKY